MPKLYTRVRLPQLPKIDYTSTVVLLGSCFTENIGRRLCDAHFDAVLNPHGTLFNPHSICKIVHSSLDGSYPTLDEFILSNGQYVHTDFHSTLARESPEASLAELQLKHETLRAALLRASYLVLTLGTSWVYLRNGQIVSNCHRIPSREFTRRCLSVDEVYGDLAMLLERLHRLNPGLRVLFTVSPVRHMRDGLRENSISKSTLHLAVHRVLEKSSNAFYFPSYEVFIDELRDYRFYATDLVHPSEIGEKVVWAYLLESLIAPEVHSTVEEALAVEVALRHRPICPSGPQLLAFYQKLLMRMECLEQTEGFRPFNTEKLRLREFLEK